MDCMGPLTEMLPLFRRLPCFNYALLMCLISNSGISSERSTLQVSGIADRTQSKIIIR